MLNHALAALLAVRASQACARVLMVCSCMLYWCGVGEGRGKDWRNHMCDKADTEGVSLQVQAAQLQDALATKEHLESRVKVLAADLADAQELTQVGVQAHHQPVCLCCLVHLCL